MMKDIILAGGCFWGVEAYFQRVKGIKETKVGYIDGFTENPTYQEVCDGSGHAEAVYMRYDEEILTLPEILKHFFRIVDPTQVDRQGNDIGKQYRSAIYYVHDEDKEIIKSYLFSLRLFNDKKIATQLVKASTFFDAEEYHQKYLDKNPNGYCHVNLDLLKEDLK